MDTWKGFKVGDRVVMDIQTIGDTAAGEELVYSAGSAATIAGFQIRAGVVCGVDVAIGYDVRTIVNTFDDSDIAELGAVPFHKA